MVLIHDVITAENVAGYWNATQENVDLTTGEKFFPAKKQLGLKLSFVKGASGKAVVLRPSAFDSKVTLRDRMNLTVTETNMPFFKEAMLVKEEDRQQLNVLSQTGNQQLIDTVVKGIFDDEKHLVSGALARIEAMRMQVLATGKISFVNNGVAQEFDYGVNDKNKATVTTGWAKADKATPLADVEKAVQALEEIGSKAELLILNAKTFALLKNAASTLTTIKPLAPKGAGVTKRELIEYLADEFGLTVVIESGTYIDDDGTAKKFYPDGYVTLAPNTQLGNTVFGTTPEESDLMGGAISGVDVQIVETGIAVTTKKIDDPVNVQTKVSMITLPSFEQLDNVYMLDIEP